MRALFYFSLLVVMSSCSLQEEGVNLESEVKVDECKKSGSTNCVTDSKAAQLELNIRTRTIQSKSTKGDCAASNGGLQNDLANAQLYCFDIAADCSEGTNETAYLVVTNHNLPPTQNFPAILGRCVRGRVNAQITVDFSGVNETSTKQVYRLELELIGKTITNEEVTNPAFARKFVDIQAPNYTN